MDLLEYIGEGFDGDYDSEDKDDSPLIRFSCFYLVDGEWWELNDSSYCTNLLIDTSQRALVWAASEILEAIQDVDYKHRLQELSWLCLKDFEKVLDVT